jgi:WD40 repeat protein
MLTSASRMSRSYHQANHSNVVTSVAFSPDGLTLASGSWDGTLKLWEVGDGRPKLKQTFRGEWDEVEAVAFAPDGSTIAGLGVGFDNVPFGMVKVWAIGATRGRVLIRQEGKIDAIAFSPDGATLATACGDRGSVMLLDVPTGEERAVLSGHRAPIWAMAYAPDGKGLAVASGVVPALAGPAGAGDTGEVRLWDLAATVPSTRARLDSHEHGVISVAISPDGAMLASGGFDRTVKIWNMHTGRERASLTGHKGWVAAVAFSPDGSLLATGSHDQLIKLWDAATGQELAILGAHSGAVYTLAFSPDGSRLASGSLDGTVRVWDVEQAIA